MDRTGFFAGMNESQKPQINLARSTAGRMWLVSLCALMAVVQSSLGDSYSSLLVALGAVSAAILAEYLILGSNRGKRALLDGSAVASALILSLLLPNRISPAYAAAGAAFGMAVIKHSFGGLGSNWLNPAAGGWLFVRFSWPASFAEALKGSPDLSTVFSSAASGNNPLNLFLNKTVFSFLGVELPSGYMDLFASRLPGIIADRGVFAILLGTIIITASQVSRAWIPAVYLAVFGFLVRLAGALPFGAGSWNGDVLYMLCTGGTLVAAFFLTADPATGAKSSRGIFFSALASGSIAFVFRCFGNEPYGVVITAVLINALLPLVRVFESKGLYEMQGTPIE